MKISMRRQLSSSDESHGFAKSGDSATVTVIHKQQNSKPAVDVS